MKLKVKAEDFSEETIYVIECPYCEEMIESQEDINYLTEIDCEHCNGEIKIEH